MDNATGRGLTSVRSVRVLLVLLYGIPLSGVLNIVCSIVWVLGSVPAGTSIRPMGLAMWIFVVEVFTTVAGAVLSVTTIVWWRKEGVLWVNALVTLVLSLTPAWVGVHFFRWFSAYRGLILSD